MLAPTFEVAHNCLCNELKIEMLGTAIQQAQDAYEEYDLSQLIDEPSEATNVRYAKGVVAIVMERESPPETLSELRVVIDGIELRPGSRDTLQYTYMDLLDDGILILDSDRGLRFNPPQTKNYVRATLIED